MPRKEISYNPEDFGKDAVELRARYFATTDEHPEYTKDRWQKLLSKFPEVEDKFADYWDWVVVSIEADNEDAPDAGHAQQVAMTEADMVDVNTIDQFAEYVTRWHHNKVAVLRHMQGIPAGSEMEVTIGDKAKTIVLDGELMAAFQAGLELALIEIGNLPFGVSTEDAPEGAANDAADPSQG